MQKTQTSDPNSYPAEDHEWDQRVLALGAADYMQSSAWGESKPRSHWPMRRATLGSVPMQVFSRVVPVLGTVYYVPNAIGVTAKNVGVITEGIRSEYSKGLDCKFEIYQPYSDELMAALQANGWSESKQVQYRNTVIVDLSGTESDILARLKRRARYEVRAAEKAGVIVERVEPTAANRAELLKIMHTTKKRSGAFFRSERYINDYWDACLKRGQGNFYFARHENDILAGAFVITFGKSAWYKDGGSVRVKSNLYAPRLLQWGIMKDLQARGIMQYDLCGIPAPEAIESSSMKGLYAFKTGFTDNITRLMPAMVLPLSSRYPIWHKLEPYFLRLYSGLTQDFWY